MLLNIDYPIELIRLALHSHVRSAIANFGSMLVFVFALKEFVPGQLIFSWFFIHSSVMLLRFYYFHRIKVKLEKEDKQSQQGYQHEVIVLISLFFSSGLLWGTAIWLSVIYAPLPYIFLCIILLLGLAGGAIATLSPLQSIYTAFVIPIMISQFFALLYMSTNIAYSIAVLTFLYTPVVYKASQTFYSYMLESIQQKHALEKARQEADIANQAKSIFLANMSHEIRTPLNGVVTLIQLLSHKELDIEQSNIIEKMNISAQHLQDLLNDVLDLSKIESGKLKLESITYQPRNIIKECILAFDSQVTEKCLQIKSSIQPAVPEFLFGDAHSLSQILFNLISNAIKFTDSGSITIELDINEIKGKQIFLILSVTDTGIGIPDQEQQKIFSNFTQLDSSITRQYDGTGLGLSICRHLLDLMGGSIEVNSNSGMGSCFTCRLPMMKTITKVAPDKPQSININLHKMHILVVDDDEINRYALKGLLEVEGMQVSLAESGQQALVLATEKKFDLVLMDLHMPKLNGWDTTRLFRASSLNNLSGVPIIGLTADVLIDSHELCLEVGMNSVIMKPFNFSVLLQQIQHLSK